jgi:hypothetical protein
MFSDKDSHDGSTADGNVEYSANPISTLCVLDLENFGLANCTQKMMDQVKLYIKTDNVCYPETLGKMLVINAPWLINKIWAVIKGWLDPRTCQKIEIIGGKDGIKRLRELVSKDQLPARYGGDAGDIYYHKPHTEYQLLPRGGEYTYEITIEPGMSVVVDTYVSEIAVEYTVESRLHPSADELASENDRKAGDKGGWSWGGKKDDADQPVTYASLAYMATKTQKKCTLEPDSTGRLRHIHTIMSAELGNSKEKERAVQVQITWKNTARMSRYAICFGVTPTE